MCVLYYFVYHTKCVCVLGDVWAGHQHVSVSAHHVCVGVVTDHSLDEGHVTGERAAGRELQHQCRQSDSPGERQQLT